MAIGPTGTVVFFLDALLFDRLLLCCAIFRECYAHAVGLSIGWINLAKGHQNPGLADQLRLYMVGGHKVYRHFSLIFFWLFSAGHIFS